jgi:hypothetical protein
MPSGAGRWTTPLHWKRLPLPPRQVARGQRKVTHARSAGGGRTDGRRETMAAGCCDLSTMTKIGPAFAGTSDMGTKEKPVKATRVPMAAGGAAGYDGRRFGPDGGNAGAGR